MIDHPDNETRLSMPLRGKDAVLSTEDFAARTGRRLLGELWEELALRDPALLGLDHLQELDPVIQRHDPQRGLDISLAQLVDVRHISGW